MKEVRGRERCGFRVGESIAHSLPRRATAGVMSSLLAKSRTTSASSRSRSLGPRRRVPCCARTLRVSSGQAGCCRDSREGFDEGPLELALELDLVLGELASTTGHARREGVSRDLVGVEPLVVERAGSPGLGEHLAARYAALWVGKGVAPRVFASRASGRRGVPALRSPGAAAVTAAPLRSRRPLEITGSPTPKSGLVPRQRLARPVRRKEQGRQRHAATADPETREVGHVPRETRA